ncbi:GMC family oxidoreductase [Paenibacillus roseipurpureus]|uniref:GMC family oxidoreductase n=1 Tax=Paenibacillus roseopurpureus TaxID=2918901 RepID=A0AA96LPB3_9BACL|nr:GMC family oxidoreductase [Paenibacillus sp. MBLB1832]WNR44806.1 GMC family oxidoreductase [Paenibacillus sp. MBLB1832]
MKWRNENEIVDIVIVGAGAAGGVLAKELSEAGLGVVVLDAGPWRDPLRDFASDELSMQTLRWEDTRLVEADPSFISGHHQSGKGIGGGTQNFTGVFLRFHESDFKTKAIDGVGEDWPFHYKDLEPYYTKIEHEASVSGPKHFPWGNFHGPYPYPAHESLSQNAILFQKGCKSLGIQSALTPLAILSEPAEGRPACINRGFCLQGCMPQAKFSTLSVHIPKAVQAGAEILAECRVIQIEVDCYGHVCGVLFVHHGTTYRQRAKTVILCAHAVETPRLLLHSATPAFPDGLANSSGWVGRAIMTHSSHDVYAKFEQEVRLYKGIPVLASTQDFYETDPRRGFVRGYTLHAHGSRPIEMAEGIRKATHAPMWGTSFRQTMQDYNFYGRLKMVGEVLPDWHNHVSLSDEKDEWGMPIASLSFHYSDNDLRLIDHAVDYMSMILRAAGGENPYVVPDTQHLMGGCRMGNDPSTSVVNSYGQSHDIPNLFICDASIFVTSSGGNPTLTVMALAARTADYIIDLASS